MADQAPNEEFLRLQEETNRIIEKGLPLRQQDLEHAEKNRELNLKINAQLAQTSQSLKALGKSALDGQLGVTQFNQGIDATATGFKALSTFLGTLQLFAGPLGIALKVLTFGVGLAAKAFKTVNEQSEALFKSYQDLSKTGQSAAGGMTEVFNNMQKFGYGIKELDQMTALLKENSVALAAFGGTAATGSKAFADAAGQIQRSDIGKTFQMMGKTPDEINKGIAGFIRQQQLAGVSSATIQKDLAQRSAEYVKQLDLMSKLTGESNEALQANRESALAESAFNQTIYELQKKGDMASLERAAELQKASDLMAKTPALQKEFWQGVGGDISAMGKSLMISADAVLYTQEANFKAATFVDKFAKGADSARESLGSLYKFNALDNVLGSAKELSIVQSRYATTTAKNQEEMAKAQQEAQIEGLNPNTKAMVNARIEQMKTRDALEGLVQKGVGPATSALEGFSKVINYITEKVPLTGSPNTKDKPIGGDSKTKDTAPAATPASTGATPATAPATAPASTGVSAPKIGDKTVTIGDETRIGGDRNWRNNNPGNIEYGKFAVSMGAIGSDGRFAIFPSEAMGRTAQDALLKGEAYANKTAADAIRKWAPKNENDSEKYIKTVANLAGVSMDKKYVDMSKEEQERFLAAMSKMEGGKAGTVNKATSPTTTATTKNTDTAQDPYFKPFDLKASLQYSAMANRKAELAFQKAEREAQSAAPKPATAVAPKPTTAVAPVEKKETNPRRMTTAATAPSAPPSAAPKKSIDQAGLSALGLRLRPSGGDIQAEGAGISENLISLAQNIQGKLSGFNYFSGFNDNYHLREAPNSKHTQGRALDFALGRTPTKEEGAQLVSALKSMGASYVRDEYNNPSSKSTAPHMHAEVSARDGFQGILSGPSSGYTPTIEMHGREQLSITPANAGSTANLMGGDSADMMKKQLEKLDQVVQVMNQSGAQAIMTMQLDRLDELVRVMQNQVSVSTKILQQSR